MNIVKFVVGSPKVAILAKDIDVQESKKTTLATTYLTRLLKVGIKSPAEDVIFIGLPYPKSGNIKKDFMVSELNEILNYCDTVGIDTILVSDSKYYNTLTKCKVEETIGTIQECVIVGYTHIKVLPCMNPIAIQIAPNKEPLFAKSISTLGQYMLGVFKEEEYADIVGTYPKTYKEVDELLSELEKCDKLTVDIETRSNGEPNGSALRYERGILSTVSISKDKFLGVAFPTDEYFCDSLFEVQVRQRLKQFFINTHKNTDIILHNGLFDAKYLIRTLFMNSDDDYEGMYEGINIFKDMIDTMILAYLCLNSTTKPEKNLKALGKEFIGNYAEDVKDITKIPLDRLLEYNVKDTCATMYVYEKYSQMLKEENQEDVYNTIFKPSQGFLLEMMMTGLPVDISKVDEVEQGFEEIRDKALDVIRNSEHVKRAEAVLRYNAKVKYNSEHKKQKTDEDFLDVEFKPSSVQQKKLLLIDILSLEVKDTTDTGAPSLGADIMQEYLAEAKYAGDTDVEELISALIDYDKSSKMLGTFVKAIRELSTEYDNGERFLKGNLKSGGTISGRLSSSEPNLQNLPSGGTAGKLIKSCFVAPDGWLFAGSDFSALKYLWGSCIGIYK